MKTLLAIVLLAAATLTFGAPITPISGTAVASAQNTWCGVFACSPKPTLSDVWSTGIVGAVFIVLLVLAIVTIVKW